MCPQARTPRTHRKRAGAAARLPQGQRLGQGECSTPDTPQGGTRRPPPPPGRLCAAPTGGKVSLQECALWGW